MDPEFWTTPDSLLSILTSLLTVLTSWEQPYNFFLHARHLTEQRMCRKPVSAANQREVRPDSVSKDSESLSWLVNDYWK